jgi:hypothetical protein
MLRRLPVTIYATGAPHRRVRLKLVAPDAGDTVLPILTGRLAAAVPGYFGLLRYLVELDARLPQGFDPLGELPWFARARSLRHLLVTPAPDAPTLQTRPDIIGETVEYGGVVHVFVSVGPTARAFEADARAATAEDRCPFLCMADLEAVPDRRIPVPTTGA